MALHVGVGVGVGWGEEESGITGGSEPPEEAMHDLIWGASTGITWGADTIVDWPVI